MVKNNKTTRFLIILSVLHIQILFLHCAYSLHRLLGKKYLTEKVHILGTFNPFEKRVKKSKNKKLFGQTGFKVFFLFVFCFFNTRIFKRI